MARGQEPNRVPELRYELLSELQASILRQLEATRGRIPTPYRIWIHSPKLARPLQELGTCLSEETSLSKREFEIAILLIAKHWQAAYVFDVHVREALQVGVPDAVIASIGAGSLPDFAEPRERLLYYVVRSLEQASPPNDELFEDALGAFGHKGLAELLVLCGYFTAVSLAMKLYQLPSPR